MKSLCLFVSVVFSLSLAYSKPISLVDIDADDPNILFQGRVDKTDKKGVKFSWPGISISASFEGRVCNIKLKDLASSKDGNPYHNFFNIVIDGRAPFVLKGNEMLNIYKIDTLQPGKHQISIFKRTESQVGECIFYGFQIEKGKQLLPFPVEQKALKIEFIGNSITCGYGNEGTNDCGFTPDTENNYLAYGSITARNLKANYSQIAFSGKGLYRNYDKTTDQTMPDLYDRIVPWNENVKWNFASWIPDVVIINLGTNDFAHENPDSAIWVSRYIQFIKRIRNNYPGAKIICCEGPMISDNWPVGNKALTTITKYLKSIVGKVNKEGDSNVYLFMFSSDMSNPGCDWHPGLQKHQKMAEDLTAFIQSVLKK